MSRQLYILMGIPGSGKSTFIKKQNAYQAYQVSRDEIRFSLVKEDEEYFSKEKEVFRKFVEEINTHLAAGHDVFVDATHINKTSRNKILRSVDHTLVEKYNLIWLNTPLEKCLERNRMREGRKFVPESAIVDMYKRMEKPELEEGFDNIFIIEEDKPIQILKKEK